MHDLLAVSWLAHRDGGGCRFILTFVSGIYIYAAVITVRHFCTGVGGIVQYTTSPTITSVQLLINLDDALYRHYQRPYIHKFRHHCLRQSASNKRKEVARGRGEEGLTCAFPPDADTCGN